MAIRRDEWTKGDARDDVRVSVVIPSYEDPERLAVALESVLAQTWRDFETIVVDDASSPGVVDRLRELPAISRLIALRERSGASAARNVGVEAARGAYVAFLDQDDRWHADKLERQVAALDTGDAAVAYCHYVAIDDGLTPCAEQPERLSPGADPVKRFVRGNVIKSCSLAMVRRDVLLRLEGLDPRLTAAGDWDLWLRVAFDHRFHEDERALVEWRTHDGQLSRDDLRMRRENVAVLDKVRARIEAERPDLVGYLRRRLSKALRKLAAAERRPGGDPEAASLALGRAARVWPWNPKVYLDRFRAGA